MIVHQMDAKIDSLCIYTKHLIKLINERFHVAANNYLVIVASDRARRRLRTLRWLPARRSWRCDPHSLYLLLELLMHVFDKIMLSLPVVFGRSLISVSVENQVIVVVIFVRVVFFIGSNGVEIRV